MRHDEIVQSYRFRLAGLAVLTDELRTRAKDVDRSLASELAAELHGLAEALEVHDQHGRALQGVMVMLILEGLRGRTELTVTTDAQGIAVFADLPLVGTMVAVAEGVRSDVTRRRPKAMRVSLQLPRARPP